MSEVYVVNPNMKNPPLEVGVIGVPDHHPKVVLYNPEGVNRDLRKINEDIYVQRKKHERHSHDRKFPISVVILSGLALLLGSFGIVKHFVKK